MSPSCDRRLGRRAAGVVVLAAACAVLPAAALAKPGGHGLVTPDGKIGPLRIDRSDYADIVAFAGRPQIRSFSSMDGPVSYLELGYGCGRHVDGFPVRDLECLTAFYINSHTTRLVLFGTRSHRYHTVHGIHVGMSSDRVEVLLRQQLTLTCEDPVFRLGSPRVRMRIETAGGHTEHDPNGTAPAPVGEHIVGARLWAMALHSRRNDLSGFPCL